MVKEDLGSSPSGAAKLINMNKKIIKFKFFKTSEEFEEFQNQNDISVIQISPLIYGMKGNINEELNGRETGIGRTEETSSGDFSATTNVGSFVVYTNN